MAWGRDDPWAPVYQYGLPPMPGAPVMPGFWSGTGRKKPTVYFQGGLLDAPPAGSGQEPVTNRDFAEAMAAYGAGLPETSPDMPAPSSGKRGESGGLLDSIKRGFGDRDIHGGTTAGGLLGSPSAPPPRTGGATAPAVTRPAGAGLLDTIKGGWNRASEWMNEPAYGGKATRAQVAGEALTAMAGGILSARGSKYYGNGPGNALGQGFIGLNQSLGSARREAAQEQYKDAAMMLQLAKQRAALAAAEKPEKVGAGERLVDPTTGKELYAAPDKAVAVGEGQQLRDPMTGELRGAAVPKTEVVNGQVIQVGPDGTRTLATAPSQDAQNAAYANMNPQQRAAYAQGLINKLNEGPTRIAMTASPTYMAAQGESANSRKIGEEAGADFATMQREGGKAATAINSIQSMRALLEKVPTGPGEGVTDWLRRAAVASNVANPETAANLSGRDAFNALHNTLVRDDLGTLGSGVSGADLEFTNRAYPSGEMTKQSNEALLDMKEAANRRKMEVAAYAAKWQARPGRNVYGLDERGRTFQQALMEDVASKPLYSEEEKKRILKKLGYQMEPAGTPGHTDDPYDGLIK